MLHPDYSIILARPQDLAGLGGIERAAATLLRGHMPDALLDDAIDVEELSCAQREGRLWVALRGESAVGFALVVMLDAPSPHLEEIDVHPDHGRRGVGTALVGAVCEWAATSGYRRITLTTFRDVAWNMPFYARLGFREMPVHELDPKLATVVRAEAARGLDPTRRTTMIRELAATTERPRRRSPPRSRQ